jgi:hypothetical protein
VLHDDKYVSENYLDFIVYNNISRENEKNVYIYDPLKKIAFSGTSLDKPSDISNVTSNNALLIIGPYGMDRRVMSATDIIYDWCKNGGCVVVLEQNPNDATEDVLGTGISFVRKTQPYWSRWATNMIKHADRADILDKEHSMFRGISGKDMDWWNGDTYLAHTCLGFNGADKDGCHIQILSRIGNGLLPEELMPVEYKYIDSGYSTLAMEMTVGKGRILITSLLIGSKINTEPVARQLLFNLL